MSSIMPIKKGLTVTKDMAEGLLSNGKYGCIIVALGFIYNLCENAMEKGYAFNVSCSEGKIDFNFTPPVTMEK